MSISKGRAYAAGHYSKVTTESAEHGDYAEVGHYYRGSCYPYPEGLPSQCDDEREPVGDVLAWVSQCESLVMGSVAPSWEAPGKVDLAIDSAEYQDITDGSYTQVRWHFCNITRSTARRIARALGVELTGLA